MAHRVVTRGRQFAVLVVAVLCIGVWAKAGHDSGLPVSTVVDVKTSDLLRHPPGANWPSYNGDYTGRRYSSLAQINVNNARQLSAQWVFHSPNSAIMETTPVVIDGIMFATAGNDVFALDARTGREIWHHSRPFTQGLIDDASAHHNRGVAIWHSRIFVETDNAHLLCLDARSGHLIWDIAYADTHKNYGATSVPLIVKDDVLVGTSGGDDGVRGFLDAFDVRTGKLRWRFWTIPRPGQFGSSSWPGKSFLHGGGSTWMPGTYDPELNTLYWGTSNPSPDMNGSVRPGDDLYTDCVVALDAATGTLKWYFQFTPHDLYDYDSEETPVLIDTTYNGKPRKLLVEANRNGFLYVLDRTDGKFLKAVRFVKKLNWARGIDRSGRPMRTGLKPSAKGTEICPGFVGASNWFSPSFNPATRTLYFMALEACNLYYLNPASYTPGRTYYDTGVRRVPGEYGQKILLAYDLATNRFAWRYPQAGLGRSWAGTMTTAGELVFFGDDSGSLEAVDARTGEPLWHFNTGQEIHASPMCYAIKGRQYVAIAAGSDLFAFALPD
jgi:alcohol dehydrogenase (cytochrome c)